MRDKRSSCMWDPLRGNRRLLYDCVWIVSASQPWANPASILDERPGGSKFAPKNLSLKLHLTCHLRFRSRALVGCTSRKHGSFSDTGALLPVLAARNIQSFAKPNYLALPSIGTLRRTAEWLCLKIVIWLILPVVICLSQRLSHACLSINVIQWNCEWLIKTVIVYLIIEFTWITVVILELIHAVKPDFAEGLYLLDNKSIFPVSIVMTHNNWSNRMVLDRDTSFKFLPHQLSMVVYWTTMALTGNGGLGFDSGEGAWETATTSKEGSRRVNYPILTQGGSDKK